MPAQRGPAADADFLPTTHASNPYNFTPALLKAASRPAKVTATYIFFLGHEDGSDEAVYSQWFGAPFSAPRNPYRNDQTPVEFPTAEHYMMYHKALLMGDEDVAEKILGERHPSAVKKFGREVKDFDRKLWAEHADRVVEEGNWLKFSQNEDLRKILVDSAEKQLVEASPDDRIWGIGFSVEDAEAHEDAWGDNRMGKALMKVRARLRRQYPPGS